MTADQIEAAQIFIAAGWSQRRTAAVLNLTRAQIRWEVERPDEAPEDHDLKVLVDLERELAQAGYRECARQVHRIIERRMAQR